MKRKRTTEQEILEIYRELYDETVEDAESYLLDFEEEYKKRQEEDEKRAKIWLAILMTTPEWKHIRHTIAVKLTKADVSAATIINRSVKNGFISSFKAGVVQVNNQVQKIGLKGVYGFKIYNKDSEKYLKAKKPIFPVRKIPEKSATKWHEKQIQRIVQAGITQGKSIPSIAKEMQTVCKMSGKASVRAARTAMTAAHNAGAQVVFEEAADRGIEMEKEWMASFDDSTRESHALIDGERVPIDEEFSNGCMFPGDPSGPPEEVWNCRCTMRAIVKGINEEERYGKSQYGRN